MPDYQIVFVRSAREELESIEKKYISRIIQKIEDLAVEPRPRGCRKLRNETFLWRIRIGHYRVIYAVYDEKRLVEIMAVRHRRKAYQ